MAVHIRAVLRLKIAVYGLKWHFWRYLAPFRVLLVRKQATPAIPGHKPPRTFLFRTISRLICDGGAYPGRAAAKNSHLRLKIAIFGDIIRKITVTATATATAAAAWRGKCGARCVRGRARRIAHDNQQPHHQQAAVKRICNY